MVGFSGNEIHLEDKGNTGILFLLVFPLEHFTKLLNSPSLIAASRCHPSPSHVEVLGLLALWVKGGCNTIYSTMTSSRLGTFKITVWNATLLVQVF